MQSHSLKWAPPIYFLYYAAGATLFPFLVLYFQELRLTGSQIGLLMGIPPLLGLVSAPIWSAASDITKRHKVSLLVAIVGAVVFVLLLSVIKSFAWLIFVIAIFSFFYSPIMPLVDGTTMSLLGDQKEQYGKIRLWGAIGWGIAAPIMGWLIESNTLLWAFWGYAILLCFAFFFVLSIPTTKQNTIETHTNFQKFLTDPRWFFFLAVAFCGGVILSMISSFLFIFLDNLGADKITLGLTLTFATLSEIPVLFFSHYLLRKWNAKQLMGVALLFFAIRSMAYTFIVTAWLAFFIQLLHGLTFSLMWLGGVSYADKIAPKGLETTAQGLFSGTMLGIGSAVGSFLGGLLYENFGLISMFRTAAFISLLGMGLLFLAEKNRAKSI